jgi:hypothetical protein
MMRYFAYLILLIVFASCSTEITEQAAFKSEITEISTLFDQDTFDDPQLVELLTELNICYIIPPDSAVGGEVPCSPHFFAFYPYTDKRPISDAFLLQVRKGVNNYPFRRLLIFVREKGQLVLVTGVNGYLVEKRSTINGIDDLVVGVVDNIGGHYERYDVLLHYKDGKYHYVEALGDLEGRFEDEELKERATQMIGERIKDKNLVF